MAEAAGLAGRLAEAVVGDSNRTSSDPSTAAGEKKRRKIKPKWSSAQRRARAEAQKNASGGSDPTDGLFFIDTEGNQLPEDFESQRPVLPQPAHLEEASEKIVPDYVGAESEVDTQIAGSEVVQGSSRDLEEDNARPGRADGLNEEDEGEESESASEADSASVGSEEQAPKAASRGKDVPVEKDSIAALIEEQSDDEDMEDDAANAPGGPSGLRYWKEDDDSTPLVACHRCGEVGHTVRDCEHIQCMTCGRLDDHTNRECPLTMTCYRCSSRGHHIKDCPVDPSQARRPINIVCERCSSRLHASSNCPYIWRIYIRSATAPAKPPRNIHYACYNCASADHFGDDCKFPRAHPIRNVDRSAFTDQEAGPRKIRFDNQDLGPIPGTDAPTTAKMPRPNIVNGVKQKSQSQKQQEEGRNSKKRRNKGKDPQSSRPSLQEQLLEDGEEPEHDALSVSSGDGEEENFADTLASAPIRGARGDRGGRGRGRARGGKFEPFRGNRILDSALGRSRREVPNNGGRSRSRSPPGRRDGSYEDDRQYPYSAHRERARHRDRRDDRAGHRDRGNDYDASANSTDTWATGWTGEPGKSKKAQRRARDRERRRLEGADEKSSHGENAARGRQGKSGPPSLQDRIQGLRDLDRDSDSGSGRRRDAGRGGRPGAGDSYRPQANASARGGGGGRYRGSYF